MRATTLTCAHELMTWDCALFLLIAPFSPDFVMLTRWRDTEGATTFSHHHVILSSDFDAGLRTDSAITLSGYYGPASFTTRVDVVVLQSLTKGS